jgi:hypothetical protein
MHMDSVQTGNRESFLAIGYNLTLRSLCIVFALAGANRSSNCMQAYNYLSYSDAKRVTKHDKCTTGDGHTWCMNSG